nr:MAG TPA: hypothetical protein [Caudoviricetes sp.]
MIKPSFRPHQPVFTLFCCISIYLSITNSAMYDSQFLCQ